MHHDIWEQHHISRGSVDFECASARADSSDLILRIPYSETKMLGRKNLAANRYMNFKFFPDLEVIQKRVKSLQTELSPKK